MKSEAFQPSSLMVPPSFFFHPQSLQPHHLQKGFLSVLLYWISHEWKISSTSPQWKPNHIASIIQHQVCTFSISPLPRSLSLSVSLQLFLLCVPSLPLIVLFFHYPWWNTGPLRVYPLPQFLFITFNMILSPHWSNRITTVWHYDYYKTWIHNYWNTMFFFKSFILKSEKSFRLIQKRSDRLEEHPRPMKRLIKLGM